MSALAKKMMEKYGWKEGEGLGKDRSGMRSYVKVTRRDPHTATGLGHAADPAQGGSLASTHAVELDAIYGQLHKSTDKKERPLPNHTRGGDASASGDDDDDDSDRVHDANTSSSSSTSASSTEKRATASTRAATKRQRSASSSPSTPSSSSSSDSDDDDDDEARPKSNQTGDVTRMSDKDLFQRCGGVRLGRAGRHRFFDGKLRRIHDSS
ncbi:G-patch domain containing protein [Novymonas esmeraldas]|uniref:G-patch domain containing protein n=1 Tax=Novymonas esmeraldas TaxID=1808958 RepID=A0AAW0EWE6_9TRYP